MNYVNTPGNREIRNKVSKVDFCKTAIVMNA